MASPVASDHDDDDGPDSVPRDDANSMVTSVWFWVAVIAAILGGYFSALSRSLQEFSRSKLEAKLDGLRLRDRVEWLMARLDGLMLMTAALRAGCSVFLVLGVTIWLEPGAEDANPAALISATLVVVAWFWLVHVGLAWALSEHIATPVVAWSMRPLILLSLLERPITEPLHWLNEVVRRLAGVAADDDDLEDEIRYVMEESEREGTIGEVEKEMIEAIVDFRTVTVEEAMTPRIDVEGIQYTDDLSAIRAYVVEEGHSRFPVYGENLDEIQGILYVKDLLPYLGRDAEDFVLRDVLREAIFVPESRRVSDLLADFQQRKVHMAIVLDEYGGTAGLITIEDIVEEIVGEIRDEHEPVDVEDPTMSRNDDGTVDVDARIHIDDLNDELDLNLPEDADYDTVGGWVFSTLGRIPDQGERFTAGRLEVTVSDAERTHVKRVRLRVLSEYEESPAPVDLDTASETPS
ncbi:MAG: hemolysin family protein [Phycisphaerales bacterium]